MVCGDIGFERAGFILWRRGRFEEDDVREGRDMH